MKQCYNRKLIENFKIMAKESVDILKGKIDVKKVLEQLNAALAEEWLAFYQYWAGALIIEGPMRTEVQKEMEEHAQEEYEHAKLLADRIIELEGVPVLSPQQWFDLARCKYLAPDDFGVVSILNQNIASERCAIKRYSEIANFTDGLDFTTCDIAKHIMAEEEDHEQDLQDFINDINRMVKYLGRGDLFVSYTKAVGNCIPNRFCVYSCFCNYRLQELQRGFICLKKSFPLSSTRIKAGKFSTSIFQIASIPNSGYSRHSTFLMLFCANIAAGPPILPK